jgi:hypothetical protein
MPNQTPKGVPYAAGTDPNDLTLHTQGLADWIDARPGVSPLTTAQRDALTGADLWDGRVILNLDTERLQRYDATAANWQPAGIEDHGALGGLADDDHPQYAKKAGDTFTGPVAVRAGAPTYRFEETDDATGAHWQLLVETNSFNLERVEGGAVRDGFHVRGNGEFWLPGNVRPLASLGARTYYVDAVNGNDANGGATAATAIKTLAEVGRRTPHIIRRGHPYVIRIIGSITESVIFEAITLGDDFSIIGDSGNAANHTITGYIDFQGLSGHYYDKLRIQHLTVLQDTEPIRINGTVGGHIANCILGRVSAAVVAGSVAIGVRSSSCFIENTSIGTDQFENGIISHVNAKVYSRTNSGNATKYGLWAANNGALGKSGTQPTGTTAAELVQSGGVIR